MGVVRRGRELVTAGHTASDTIDKKGAELMEAWSELSQAVTTRSQLLSDSLAVQQVRVCGWGGGGEVARESLFGPVCYNSKVVLSALD